MVPGADLGSDEMPYELMGRIHAYLTQERGQGTVEYVALILLLGAVMAAMVTASGQIDASAIGKTIVGKLKGAIDGITVDK